MGDARIVRRSFLRSRLGGALWGAIISIMTINVVESANVGNAWAALYYLAFGVMSLFLLVCDVVRDEP